MGRSFYALSTAILFVIVGLLHAYRAVNEMPLIYGTYEVPMLVSWLVALAAFSLAFSGLKHR